MKFQQILLAAAVLALQNLHSSAATHYVDLNSTNPTPPYTDWSTAATDIQSAIDASSDGDLILVTNGIYATGGRVVYGSLTNRVVINKAVTVQSVNGSAVTMIRGNQPPGNNAVRCVYLTNNAMLVGFTLTNGACRAAGNILQEDCGGGSWCESSSATISNCVLSGNVTSQYGGGAFGGVLLNCTIVSNACPSAGGEGGGIYQGMISNCIVKGNQAYMGGAAILQSTAYNSVISSNYGSAVQCVLIGCIVTANSYSGTIACTNYNCIIAGNSGGTFGGMVQGVAYNCLVISNGAGYCGGAYLATLYNCTVIYNSGGSFGGIAGGSAFNSIIYSNSGPNYSGGTLNYCDTTPLASGLGNITNEPDFVNLAEGDFHLQSNSPCINAGKNSYVTNTTDLDGNPRIVGGTVDIGAYEYQTPSSILSYAWAQQYGLLTDGSADFLDSDGDGMNNWQEWKAGTIPTNAASVLKLSSPSNSVSGMVVTWQSVNTRMYYLQSSINLGAQTAFSTIQSNIVGQVGTTSFTDTSATNGGPYFYRVGVQ
jgi:hypothetical protein